MLANFEAEEPDQVLNVIDLLAHVELVVCVLRHLTHEVIVLLFDFVEKIRPLIEVPSQAFLDDLGFSVDLGDAVELDVVLGATLGLSLVDFADDLLYFGVY